MTPVTDSDPGGGYGRADQLTDRIGLGVLTRLVHRDLVDEVPAETGRTERRRRLLPARVVVYFVLRCWPTPTTPSVAAVYCLARVVEYFVLAMTFVLGSVFIRCRRSTTCAKK